MKETRCSLCGKSVFSGAILTSVTDRSGTRSMACRAWCGPTPAPVMSVERLEQVRRAASTDLERELLAEIDLTFRLVRRAEMDAYEAAADAWPGLDATRTTGLCGWRRIHVERYERLVGGVLWALEDCDETEIGPDDPGAGWFLYGPGEYAEGRYVGASDDCPTEAADALIAAARLQARCTAEYGGPGYTACTLPAGHDGHHTAPMGTMRTARWATNRAAAESGGVA